jgi:hypothetical protein
LDTASVGARARLNDWKEGKKGRIERIKASECPYSKELSLSVRTYPYISQMFLLFFFFAGSGYGAGGGWWW